MAVDLHPDIVQAISTLSKTKLGRRYDKFSRRRYGVPGWKLAGKTVAGEFGGRSTASGRGVVSSAGARGPAQFIPSTRQAYMERYGVDPWAGDPQAIKGLMLHQLNTGVEGYNPGMPTYKDYILGQRLNRQDRSALRGRASRGGTVELQGRRQTTVGAPTYTVPGQSFEAERRSARRELLLSGDVDLGKLLAYKQSVNSLRDVPERQVTGELQVTRTQGPPTRLRTRGNKAGAPSAQLLELFHDPGVNVKNGQRTGPIGGHGKHVHVALSSPRAINWAARLAQSMGGAVRENPKWDPVDPVHTEGSFHYQRFKRRPRLGKAIDVSFADPKKALAYNRAIARAFK